MVGERRNIPTDVLISSTFPVDGWVPVGLSGLIFTFNFLPMSPSMNTKILTLFTTLFRSIS